MLLKSIFVFGSLFYQLSAWHRSTGQRNGLHIQGMVHCQESNDRGKVESLSLHSMMNGKSGSIRSKQHRCRAVFSCRKREERALEPIVSEEWHTIDDGITIFCSDGKYFKKNDEIVYLGISRRRERDQFEIINFYSFIRNPHIFWEGTAGPVEQSYFFGYI